MTNDKYSSSVDTARLYDILKDLVKDSRSLSPDLLSTVINEYIEDPVNDNASINNMDELTQSESNSSDSIVTPNYLNANLGIAEDWNGGYKLKVDFDLIEGELSDREAAWQFEVSGIEGTVSEAYGFEVVEQQNDRLTLSVLPEFRNNNSSDNGGVLIIDSDRETPGSNDLHLVFPGTTDEEIGEQIDIEAVAHGENPQAHALPNTGVFNYAEALQKNFLFYGANRSGVLPEDNRIAWRSDSTVNDGSDVGVDLEGGYFDAGDHIKFIQPTAFSSTMLAWGGIDYQEAYQQAGQLDELQDAVKWGTDWLLKAHEMNDSGVTEKLWVQVGNAQDHQVWVSPEEVANVTDRPSYFVDAENPGSDAAAGTASALASAAILFRGVDDAYADKLIKNAEALYDFAETYQAKYSDSVPEASPFYTSYSGFYDELALGGAWLYKATGNSKYLDKSDRYFKENIGNLGDWTYTADDHSYGAVMMLAKETGDSFYIDQYEQWIDTWVNEEGDVKDIPGGFAVRSEWASIPLNQSTAFAAEWYNDHIQENSTYSDFATSQVDYVLGDNPNNFSFQIGFGDNYPLRPHHRGSHPVNGAADTDVAQNTLWGAVVGGPLSSGVDSYNDVRSDFRTNEVGIGYNAPFASAVVQQYEQFSGNPLSDSELDMLENVVIAGV